MYSEDQVSALLDAVEAVLYDARNTNEDEFNTPFMLVDAGLLLRLQTRFNEVNDSSCDS